MVSRVLLTAFVLVQFGASLGTLGTAKDAEAHGFLGEWERRHGAAAGPPDWWAEASLVAPLGTAIRFTVDWEQQSVSLVPLAVPPLEPPDPDAGCLVTGYSSGWLVEPPGVRAMDDCAERTFFEWPIARSSLICVLTSGECLMVADVFSALIVGNFIIRCQGGPGAVIAPWLPTLQGVGTMNCGTGILGSLPTRWDIWFGFVASAPNTETDPGLAWGLNWRVEP